MIKITSVNKEGNITERKYDNRRLKFYTMDDKEIFINPKYIKAFPSPSGFQQQNNQRSTTNNGQCSNMANNGQRSSNGHMMNNNGTNQRQQSGRTYPPDKKEKYFNKLTSDTKSKDVRLLKIQMGLACNFSCSYCKQAIHVMGAATTNMKDVEEFIEKFDTWCDAPADEPIRIELWGGEPLVYIKKIELLVPFLKKRFKYPEISILSNGSLVSEKIVNFLLENDIRLAMSHDGPEQLKTRTEDPLSEGSKSLEWIRYYISKSKYPLYVNAVLSKQNHDIENIVKYIKNILGPNVTVGFEGIVNVEDEAQFDESTLFSDEDYYNFRQKIQELYKKGIAPNIPPFNMKTKHLINSWIGKDSTVYDNYLQKCGMDSPYTLAVNLKGEALVCHSVNTVIGHVDDYDNIKMSNGGVGHWSTKEECKSCPVLNLCHGSCMNLHGNAWYYTCNNEFHFNLAIFESVFEHVFNEKIIEISGDIIRPKKQKVINISSGRPNMTPCAT